MKLLIILFLVKILALANGVPEVCPTDKEVTRYPYEGNCTLFWQCYDGNKFLLRCPEGLEYDVVHEKCDDPAVAKCNPVIGPTTPRPNTTTTITTSTSTTTAIPVTNTTSTSTVVTSPVTSTTTTTQGPWTTTGPFPTCPNTVNGTIYFPYPGDCTRYFECFAGNRFLYSCPRGLWWHPSKVQCDYPGSYCIPGTTPNPVRPPTTTRTTTTTTVRTTTTTPRTTTTTTPTTSTIRPVDCSKDSFWPHPTDCSRYIQCSDGRPFENICPKGLYFSLSQSACVYKYESECCRILVCH